MDVKIKDYEYEIIEVGDDDPDFMKDGRLQLYGEVDYIQQTIKIYKNLEPARKRQTLIHELTHAFIDAFMGSIHIKDKFDEEDVCVIMATYSEDILHIVDEYFCTK